MAMHDAVEEWLSANAFYCEKLSAQLQPAQCLENRRKAKQAGKALTAGPLFHCKQCEGVQGMSSKKGNCPTCKRDDVTLVVADKCARCYDRVKKGKDPVTGETLGTEQTQPHETYTGSSLRTIDLHTGIILNRPKATGLDALLGASAEPNGLTIPFTAEELAVLREFEVTAEHIHHLVIMGLEGKLQPAVQSL